MANAALIIPEDMSDVFTAMAQDCGAVQRQWIGDAVDASLRQQSISYELRSQVRKAIDTAQVDQLPDCYTHARLWIALGTAFKDWVADSSQPMGLPAPLLAAIRHLSR